MAFKVLLEGETGRTVVSDHRTKTGAKNFKAKVNRARKKGRLKGVKSVTIKEVKRLTRN